MPRDDWRLEARDFPKDRLGLLLPRPEQLAHNALFRILSRRAPARTRFMAAFDLVLIKEILMLTGVFPPLVFTALPLGSLHTPIYFAILTAGLILFFAARRARDSGAALERIFGLPGQYVTDLYLAAVPREDVLAGLWASRCSAVRTRRIVLSLTAGLLALLALIAAAPPLARGASLLASVPLVVFSVWLARFGLAPEAAALELLYQKIHPRWKRLVPFRERSVGEADVEPMRVPHPTGPSMMVILFAATLFEIGGGGKLVVCAVALLGGAALGWTAAQADRGNARATFSLLKRELEDLVRICSLEDRERPGRNAKAARLLPRNPRTLGIAQNPAFGKFDES